MQLARFDGESWELFGEPFEGLPDLRQCRLEGAARWGAKRFDGRGRKR